MTREDFLDYLQVHGCTIFPLSEYGRANCIGIRNPATERQAFMDTPIDGREMRAATVCQISFKLGIEVPQCAKHAEQLIGHIESETCKKKR